MKKILLGALCLSFSGLGCATPAIMKPRLPTEALRSAADLESETAHAEPMEHAIPADPFNFYKRVDVSNFIKPVGHWGEAGDHVTYLFSGSYRASPLRMTRSVVGRRGAGEPQPVDGVDQPAVGAAS